MRLSILGIAVTTMLVLGACASNAPPPRYDPEPPADAPSAPTMSLHDQVHEALTYQMGSAASEIDVRVDGSKVYLTGTVSSQADHDRAHEIAHSVAGVTSVNHDGLHAH